MSLEVVTTVNEATYTIRLIGLMDYSTIDGFKLDIPENITKMKVDFTNIHFIDSTGIGSVLSILYTASDLNLDVEFEGLNESTRELFDTVGVFSVMEALLKGGQ